MNYPQLDLHDTIHVSSDMSAMVVGKFDFDGMTREQRVMRISALIGLFDYVKELGDLEHTSDWDWRVYVEWGEARLIAGTREDEENSFTMSDTISLNYETLPGDYTGNFDRWNYLTVEELILDAEGTANDVLVPVDQIRSITIDVL